MRILKLKKHKKVIGAVFAASFLMSSMGAIVNAATYHDYNTTVPAVNDYQSAPKKKETTGSAYNKVEKIQKDRTLVSWIENKSGSNITSKTTYSTTGKKTMNYKANASEYKGQEVRLNISTSSTTLSSAVTSGEWTPN